MNSPGYRTVIMGRLSDVYYRNNTGSKIINKVKRYAEADLESYLRSGALEVGFFYDCEYTWDDTYKFIPLPTLLDMSNRSLNYYYSKVSRDECFLLHLFLHLDRISHQMFSHMLQYK